MNNILTNIEALDQGLITEGRFADFLNVDRLEARHIANILRGHNKTFESNLVLCTFWMVFPKLFLKIIQILSWIHISFFINNYGCFFFFFI